MFRTKRSGWSAILLLLINLNCFAQFDIPVDYYSGKPIISIPIYTLSDRTLSHHINLTYDASGLKVDDKASWAGLKWALAAGGQITRELHGLPDDYYGTGTDLRTGWLHNSNASTIGAFGYLADGAGLSCTTEPGQYSFVNGLGFNRDTEPDIFKFDVGGLSGSFLFDNTGNVSNIKLVPYQDVTVVPYRTTSTSPINRFDIITANGTRFVFSTTESSTRKATRPGTADPFFIQREYQQYKDNLTYTSSWKLTSITSATGETINFGYFTAAPSIDGSEIKVTTFDGEKLEYTIEETTTKKLLTSLYSATQTVAITIITDSRTSEGYRIDQITVNANDFHTSTFLKLLKFNYHIVTSSVAGEPLDQRLFLKEVVVEDACQVYEPYQFTYHGLTISGQNTIGIPNVGSPKKDIWGFYLNHGGSASIPNIYINPGQTGYNQVNLFQKSIANEITVAGSSMVGSSTPADGTLATIRYPSGAKNYLEYQSHQFHNPVTNAAMSGGGLRIWKVTLRDGVDTNNDIVRTYEYLNPSSATSGKLITLPVYWQLTGCYRDFTGSVTPFASLTGTTEDKWKKVMLRFNKNINPDFENLPVVGYEYVTEKVSTGQGKTVFQFDVPNVYGATTATDWSMAYTHIARPAACPTPSFMTPGYYMAPLAAQSPYDYARGLLLRTSIYIESETTPIREEINTYVTHSVGGASVKGLLYDRTPYNSSAYYYTYSDYTVTSNKLKVLATTTVKERDRVNTSSYLSTVTNVTYGTNHAMPSKTVVTNSEATQRINYYKYAKDYPAAGGTIGDNQVAMIDLLNQTGQYGQLVEQTEAVKRTGESEYTYGGVVSMFENFGTTQQPQIKVKEVYSLATDGIADFALSSYNTVSGTVYFQKNSAYQKQFATFYSGTKKDMLWVEDKTRQRTAFHTDNASGIPIATIDGAEANQVAYSNFDQDTDFDFDILGFTSNDKFAEGRTGNYGLGGWRQGTSKYLRKVMQKKAGDLYVLSAWYKAPEATAGAHSFLIKVKNSSGATQVQEAIDFAATTANAWYYAEKVLDLSSTTTDITVEIWFDDTYISALTGILDEVLFKPVTADVLRSTFKTGFGPTAVVAPDGRIAKTEYTLNGQVAYIRDHDDNIVQKMNYTHWSGTPGFNPISIQTPATIYDNVPALLKAVTGCADIASLQWKVVPNGGSGAFFNGSDEEWYTFPNAGVYTITLKVTHPSYGEYTAIKNITVSASPLNVAICISAGPIEVDLCYPFNAGTTAWEMDCTSTTPNVYATTTFNASVSGCSGGATYTYQWQKKLVSSGSWTIVGSNSSTLTVQNIGTAYEVRCYVTSNCGRTGTSNTKLVYLYKSDPNCEAGDPPPGGGEEEEG